MRLTKAHEHALNIINTCWDAYEDITERDITQMTKRQAKRFVEEHIEFIIGINGVDYLWSVEKDAIKQLKLNIAY